MRPTRSRIRIAVIAIAITASVGGCADSKPPLPPYIPPSCQGKAILTVPRAKEATETEPAKPLNRPIGKDVQLQVFNGLTKAIHDVYLYPEYDNAKWRRALADTQAKIGKGLDTEAFYLEMTKLVASLGDDHSAFQSPVVLAESDTQLAGREEYAGIGVLLAPLPEKKRLTILSVHPDSTAEHSGLRTHDALLTVDGLPLVRGGKTFQWRVRGPPCTAAVLGVLSVGDKPREVTVIRQHLADPNVVIARLVPTSDGSRVGYLFIPTLHDTTIIGQVRNALARFGRLDGLIIDNRYNAGGSSEVVLALMGHFTSGTLGHFVSRSSKRPFEVRADPVHNSQQVPLVILVGKETMSFGEIFAGLLQDAGRAKVVGRATAGKVETLHGYTFRDGSRAWIAQERVDPIHSHVNWRKRGVTPDVEIQAADWDTFTFDSDPAIAEAMKVLRPGAAGR